MVFKLLNVYLKIDKPTDRDNFKFKRVETSGKLIYDLFKEYYEIQQKKIQSKIDKEIYYHINTKTLKETDLVNIINDNYLEFFKERIVEDGFQKAFKGNWGAQAHTKKVGAVQDLNRLSYNSFISHLRKINLPLDSSAKVVGPRLLHGSQYGLIDPVDTPDGGSIGIHKSMSVVATITTEYSRDLLVDWLRKNIKMMYLDECRIESINDYIKIFINCTLIGLVKDLYENIDFLKLNRRMGVLPIYTSISYSSKNKSIDLFTDAGRMCRPIYYLDEHNKLPILNGEIQKKIERKEITWKDLTYGFNIDDKNEYFKE
jgi:DNA-directed RNA polymerase II subunit RPB2